MKTVKIITREGVTGKLRYDEKSNFAYLTLKKGNRPLQYEDGELPGTIKVVKLMEELCIRNKWELWGHERTKLPEVRFVGFNQDEMTAIYKVLIAGMKSLDQGGGKNDKILSDMVEKITDEKLTWR